MTEARRRCGQAVFVAPHHERYGEVSADVFDVLGSFTPKVEGLSVDEAFLDVAGLRLHYPDAMSVAHAIRARLREALGLPASVGIARTKFLAKLASEEAKPDGVRRVAAGEELAFLHPLPVRRLWGVGEATHAALEALGVATIGDLAALPDGVLERRLGPAVGRHLADLARGVDSRAVVTSSTRSISVETTFDRDLVSDRSVDEALLALCHRLDARLRRSGIRGHTVSLKVRFADFSTITRSTTVQDAVAFSAELFPLVRRLWSRVSRGGRGIRLLGVALTGLEGRDDPEQMRLDESPRSVTAGAVDAIRRRFGNDAVVPGRLVVRPQGAPDGASEHPG
jgi:DNA polymerase-4